MNELELLITSGIRKDERFTVTEGGLRLGRSSSCDIAIVDPGLSRSHCLFELRDGNIWLTDLASANGTIVNGEEINERCLRLGDVVEVGDNLIAVVEKGGQPPAPVEPVAPVQGTVVDLGFSRRGGETAAAPTASGKNVLRPILWGLCGVIVVAAAAMLLLKKEDASVAPAAPENELKASPNRILTLAYEKVDASTKGIFRYRMSLNTEARLRVRIDDVPDENRHVKKATIVPEASLERISQSLASSGVYQLAPEYTGIAAHPNELKSIRLTVVREGGIFETSVENMTEPEELKAAVAALEAFANNELGIWAMQYSTDKLIEKAQTAIDSADKKWEEKDVDDGNIAAAVRFYKEAAFYLETVNPKPDFYAGLVDKLTAANDELDRRYREQSFKCDREIKLGDWANARIELKILCEMVPDPQDPRHVDAAAKLLDVEGRLNKKK